MSHPFIAVKPEAISPEGLESEALDELMRFCSSNTASSGGYYLPETLFEASASEASDDLSSPSRSGTMEAPSVSDLSDTRASPVPPVPIPASKQVEKPSDNLTISLESTPNPSFSGSPPLTWTGPNIPRPLIT